MSYVRSRSLATWRVLALALVAACSSPSSPKSTPGLMPAVGSASTQLAAARHRWQAARPTHYRYILSRSCECLSESTRPVVVVVNRSSGTDVVESVNYVDTGAPAGQYASAYVSVDALFDVIADAIARHAATVRVAYDAAYGYPRSIFIDYDVQMADDERGYTASGLAPVS
jgi:hypothetical protein